MMTEDQEKEALQQGIRKAIDSFVKDETVPTPDRLWVEIRSKIPPRTATQQLKDLVFAQHPTVCAEIDRMINKSCECQHIVGGDDLLYKFCPMCGVPIIHPDAQ